MRDFLRLVPFDHNMIVIIIEEFCLELQENIIKVTFKIKIERVCIRRSFTYFSEFHYNQCTKKEDSP